MRFLQRFSIRGQAPRQLWALRMRGVTRSVPGARPSAGLHTDVDPFVRTPQKMNSSNATPQPPVGALPSPQPVLLHESVVFLARFLGTPVQVERLRDSLASHDLQHEIGRAHV